MPRASVGLVVCALLLTADLAYAQSQTQAPPTQAPPGQTATQPPAGSQPTTPSTPEQQLRQDLLLAFDLINRAAGMPNPRGDGREELFQAERIFRQARRDFPGVMATTMGLAETLRLMGRGTEAIDLYNDVLRTNQVDSMFTANKGIGLIYAENQWFAQALPKLLEAYKLKSNDKEILGAIARCYQEREKLDEAMEYVQYALSVDSEDPDLHLQLASLQMQKNDYVGAEGSAQRAMRIRVNELRQDQSNPMKIRQVLQYSQFWLSVLQKYLQYKDTNPDYGAADTVDLILKRIEISRRNALLTQLLSLHDTLAWTEAMSTKHPDHVQLLLQMASLQYQCQMPKEAEATCRHVLEIAPGQAQAAQMLAEIEQLKQPQRGGAPEGLNLEDDTEQQENPEGQDGATTITPGDQDASE